MAWTFEATEAGYTKMWRTATLKGGADAVNAETFANKIIAAEAQYRAVQNATGVPWYFIGALHMRESSCNFAGVLHNGEKIIGTGRVTSLVPAGRGPFSTWAEAAIDALKLKNMHRVQLWSAARQLFEAEIFNGPGYINKGINSPYIWAGTNHEQRGKYVRDHVFDPNAEDTQLGVAAVLIRLAQKRPDIASDLYPHPTEKPPVDAEDSLIKEIQSLRTELALLPSAIASAIKGEAAPVVDPPPVPPPVVTPPAKPPAPSTTPILEKPGMGVAAFGLLLTGVLQGLGVLGPTTGEEATAAGQLLPTISAGIAALGATGLLGSWGGAISSVLSVLAKGAGNQPMGKPQ